MRTYFLSLAIFGFSFNAFCEEEYVELHPIEAFISSRNLSKEQKIEKIADWMKANPLTDTATLIVERADARQELIEKIADRNVSVLRKNNGKIVYVIGESDKNFCEEALAKNSETHKREMQEQKMKVEALRNINSSLEAQLAECRKRQAN